jgi:hypothetical protein
MNRTLLIIILCLSGCSATKDLAQGMGSTGTGAIVGTLVGAGAGVGCSKLGGSTALCTSAGLAAGSLAGYGAAQLDEYWSDQVPVLDCKGVVKKLSYKNSKGVLVKSTLKFDKSDGQYKVGEVIKPILLVQVASPEGKETGLKLVDKVRNVSSSLMKKPCGGFEASLGDITVDKEQKIDFDYDVVDEKGKSLANAKSCISVSNSSRNYCTSKTSKG